MRAGQEAAGIPPEGREAPDEAERRGEGHPDALHRGRREWRRKHADVAAGRAVFSGGNILNFDTNHSGSRGKKT